MFEKSADEILNGDKEAAEALHQKERTIRDWRQKRGLPHIKVTAKTILYRRRDLNAWLDRHAVAIRTLPC